MSDRNSYDWWTRALDAIEGRIDLATGAPIRFPPMNIDGVPELGCYRTREGRGGPWLPVSIFANEEGKVVAVVGFKQEPTPTTRLWPFIARREHVITGELYDEAIALGRWPEVAKEPEPEAKPLAKEPEPERGIGDNSAQEPEIDPLFLRRDTLKEHAELLNHKWGGQLLLKVHVDACEDERKALLATAKELSERRTERNAEPQKAIDAVNAEIDPTIKRANEVAGALKAKIDAWLAAEQKRINEQAVEKGTAVAPTKVMIGTKKDGERRRSVKAPPATATIIDLAAAAAYLVKIQHPELTALVRKVGNRQAANKALMPGMRMSWEQPAAVEKKEPVPA